MLGWMLIFTLMTITAVATALADHAGFTPPSIVASLVFGLLLVITVLTRTLRGQA
jgi:hypothetical protein